jgi:hypothetical protein
LLLELRDRSRRALERGRQLWPAASNAEYRLALEAPGELAAAVLVEGTGRFALGPLPEVAASTHTWGDLAPWLVAGPVAALFAHERVVRGEDLSAERVPHADVLSVPLRLEPWEPRYVPATYRAHRVDVDAPELPRGRALDLPAVVRTRADLEVERTLRDVVRTWTAGSEGRARVVCVEGEAAHAISALGVRDVRAAGLDPAEALAVLGWAGASGGRHGRRRGAAAGRDAAWAAALALCGLDPSELPPPRELGHAVAELRWTAWSAPDVVTGWVLRLAIEDPGDGIAWAIDATDAP